MTLNDFVAALAALPVQQQSYYLYRRTVGGNYEAITHWRQYAQGGSMPPSSTVFYTRNRGYLSPKQLVERLTPTLPQFGTGSVYVSTLGGYVEITGFEAFGAGHVTDNAAIVLDLNPVPPVQSAPDGPSPKWIPAPSPVIDP